MSPQRARPQAESRRLQRGESRTILPHSHNLDRKKYSNDHEHAWLLATVVAVTMPAAAQSIYKCKGSDGRITYSSLPCAGEGVKLPIATQGQSPAASAKTPSAGSDTAGRNHTRRRCRRACAGVSRAAAQGMR